MGVEWGGGGTKEMYVVHEKFWKQKPHPLIKSHAFTIIIIILLLLMNLVVCVCVCVHAREV